MQSNLKSLLLLSILSLPLTAQSQNLKSYGIRAGYLHSFTQVKKTGSNPLGIVGITSAPGFYLGGYFRKETSGAFLWQLEMNYQNKGQFSNDIPGSERIKNTYHYLGLTPTLGVKLNRRLSATVGPEVNLLVGEKSTWTESSAVEAGIIGRLLYQWSRLGIQAGYFRAINKYDARSFSSFGFDFINSNVQVGLVYDL